MYIFRFIGFFFGLVIFVHGIEQTAKVVMRLGDIQQIGKRHRQYGKAICPAIVAERCSEIRRVYTPFLHSDVIEHPVKLAARHHDCMEPMTPAEP